MDENNENIIEESTEKKVRSFWRGFVKFWIGFLIGLGGWLAHTVIYMAFGYIIGGGNYGYFGFWGDLGFIAMFFFLLGWEVIAIIAGIVSLKKGVKKAFSFVLIMVAILSFVVGGCTGLMNTLG